MRFLWLTNYTDGHGLFCLNYVEQVANLLPCDNDKLAPVEAQDLVLSKGISDRI